MNKMPIRNIQLILISILICVCCFSRTSLKEQIFRYVLKTVETKSLEPISEQELLEGAMFGLTYKVNDLPYTTYLPFEEKVLYEHEIQGQFAGIGISLLQKSPITGEFFFMPIPDTPAQQAGLKFGDSIVAVDDEEISGFSISELIEKLRGNEGSTVKLKIRPKSKRMEQFNEDISDLILDRRRENEAESEFCELTLTRKLIQHEIVTGDFRNSDGSWNFVLETEPSIGYICINQFTETTAYEFINALKTLNANPEVQSLILDLRGNPGGFLPAAVEICDQFLEAGSDIVTTKYRNGAVKNRFVATDIKKYKYPLVVLIDNNSASSSEIVSAALQDYDQAIIVGTRSYGKGTVQELIPLPCRMGLLHLTVAKFWRPSGIPIHRSKDALEEDSWGVHPNEGYEIVLSPLQTIFMHWMRQLRTFQKIDHLETDQNIALNLINLLNQEESTKETAIFNPQGNNPYFDPQLEKGIELLKKGSLPK